MKSIFVAFALALSAGCTTSNSEFDVVIRGGTIYDGSGTAAFVGDIAINGDAIALIDASIDGKGATEIDASGLAVAPGFINMLSWATQSLIVDGKSQSDVRQGVTLEVFGEGMSMGPMNDKMKSEFIDDLLRVYDTHEGIAELFGNEVDDNGEAVVPWTTLGEYLSYLEEKGVSTNVASFVGATTIRIHELEEADRAPTPEELDRMRALVEQGMSEGAVGLGTSLIYTPAFFAKTDELIELAKVAAAHDGLYISHMRSEGNQLLESLDELITIAREADIRAEVYHLKAAGKDNHGKLDEVIEKIESANAEGLKITADMYNYTAGATGLDAYMPPWVQEGGYDAWADRLKDPAIRARVEREMTTPTNEWENLGLAAGPDGMLLIGFSNDSLKHYTGKTLTEVAAIHGKSPAQTAMDMVIADGTRVGTVYFLMSEENVKRQIALPWLSFSSDAGSMAPEGVFLEQSAHPRAYGNFSRLLGKYVRDEKVISLEEAIRKLTALPAENLGVERRGKLESGFFADLAIFDPTTIQDHATFDKPHQYSTGMVHVFVNGGHVLKDGEHTGATPGRFVKKGM